MNDIFYYPAIQWVVLIFVLQVARSTSWEACRPPAHTASTLSSALTPWLGDGMPKCPVCPTQLQVWHAGSSQCSQHFRNRRCFMSTCQQDINWWNFCICKKNAIWTCDINYELHNYEFRTKHTTVLQPWYLMNDIHYWPSKSVQVANNCITIVIEM